MRDAISEWIARIGAPAFRRVYRFDRALRRKLTPAGWLALGTLVVTMIFGLNTREAAVYQLFGLMVGLFAVAAIAALRLPLKPRFERELPDYASAGMPFDYTVRVTSGAGRPLAGLVMEDVLAVPPADGRAFARYKVKADRTRNFFDRLVGYPRWVTFMRERMGARIEPAGIAGIAPGECVSTRLRCLPLRRGVIEFDSVRVDRPEPLGLLKAHAWRDLPGTLVVMPRVHPVAALTLPGARRLQPGGVAFAGRVGEAEEFVSLRDYRPGDSPRKIHWKAWARTGRPVVKEYQDEFFVRHALVLDTFGGGNAECFEAAVSIAASHVVQPRSRDSILDLMFVEHRAYSLSQGRGLGAAPELLRVLATVAESRGSFDSLAEVVLLGAQRLSGAIFVLLAWDDPRRRLAAALRSRGIPLRVWLVSESAAPGDLGPMASDAANFRVVRPGEVAAELLRP